MSTLVYEDAYGEIISRPEAGYTEIRWYDTSASMSGDDFNNFLAAFAGAVEASGVTGCLVDATSFRMPMDRMQMGWRDEHIIPRYNAAGVARFAFHMPSGMPAIGAPPAKEGPGDFPTAYFATRADALAWLAL